MGSEWKINLDFNGRANGFYNGNEFGKRFDYNEWMMGYKINLITKKTSLIFNNEHTKQSIK